MLVQQKGNINESCRGELRVAFRIVALFIAAQAIAASADNPWITIASSHFEVRTNASEETGREILAHFEQVRGFFYRDLKDTKVTTERVLVVAFASEEDFAPYRIKEFSRGYYYRSEDREFIVLLVENADLIDLIGVTHEYVVGAFEN